MLTRRGRAVAGLAVTMLVIGRILGITELFGLAVAAAIVVGVGAARVRAPQLRVTLDAKVVPQVISAGDRASLELTVENSGSIPTPVGRLQLTPSGQGTGPLVQIPRLVPGEHATVSLRLPTETRGRHEVTGFDAVIVDSFGTARRRLTGVGPSRYGVRPLPEILPTTLPIGGGGADLETTRSAAERLRTGASLLRVYIPGDDLRRVHWPTTARVGDLMVREGGDRERDASSGITIVLSPHVAAASVGEGEAARFEEAVRITASMAVAAESEGSFRLIVLGESDSAAGTSARHLDTVLETLVDVNPTPSSRARPGSELPRFTPDDGVVVLVAASTGLAEFATIFGGDPGSVAPGAIGVVSVLAGDREGAVESAGRGRLLVRVPVGGSLAELWSAGEAVLLRS